MKASSLVPDARRPAMPTGTAAYFSLGPSGYVDELRQGRRWTSIYGVPLHTEAEVRLNLEKDGEVWSEPGESA